jgi:hypothetical protein
LDPVLQLLFSLLFVQLQVQSSHFPWVTLANGVPQAGFFYLLPIDGTCRKPIRCLVSHHSVQFPSSCLISHCRYRISTSVLLKFRRKPHRIGGVQQVFKTNGPGSTHASTYSGPHGLWRERRRKNSGHSQYRQRLRCDPSILSCHSIV